MRFNSVGFRIARTIRQNLTIGGKFGLIAANSGLAATVLEDSAVVQMPWKGTESQIWTVVPGDEGAVRLLSVATGESLQVRSPFEQNLSRVCTGRSGSAAEEWHALGVVNK